MPRETYRSLIIQALDQTNDAKQIIAFFLNPAIKQLLQASDNNTFRAYLANLITNKIEVNAELKQQLIKNICNDHSIITLHNSVNIDNAYWFINTKLVEPVLLRLAKSEIDISNYINNLTINDILNLEHKDSLKKLCETSREKITNKDFFYQLFNKLMRHADSKAIITLVHSGLINPLLNNSYNNLLQILASKRDFSGIQLILDINSKLAKKDKFNLNAIDFNQNTLLMHIAKIGELSVLKQLVYQGVNIAQSNKDRTTALMLAAANGHEECLSILIERGADINQQDKSHWTALMHAARYGKSGCLRILIKNGAEFVNNALELATYYGHDKCKETLMNRVNRQKWPDLMYG